MEGLVDRHSLLGSPGRAIVEGAQDTGADSRPRVELLDGRVRPVRDERSGLDERQERVRACELLRPEALGEVAVGRCMAELDRGGHAESGIAREVLLGHALCVLDPLPKAFRAPVLLRLLERVECLAVREVANRVHSDRPAGFGSPPDDVRELNAARDLDARAVEHPRRLRAERSVHEGLEIAHPKERVTEPWRQACVDDPVEMLVRQRLPHTQRQRVLVAQPVPEARSAEPAVLVVHSRDTAGGSHAEPLAHRLDVLVVGNGEVPVPEAPCGLLTEDARRLAVGVPLDDTTRDLEIAAGEGQRGGVEPERVVVVGEERGGNVARDGVERPLRRRRSPFGVAPAEPAQYARRRLCVSNAVERLVQRGRSLEAYLSQRE